MILPSWFPFAVTHCHKCLPPGRPWQTSEQRAVPYKAQPLEQNTTLQPAIYSTHVTSSYTSHSAIGLATLLSETHTGKGILHQYCSNNTVEAGHVQLDIDIK